VIYYSSTETKGLTTQLALGSTSVDGVLHDIYGTSSYEVAYILRRDNNIPINQQDLGAVEANFDFASVQARLVKLVDGPLSTASTGSLITLIFGYLDHYEYAEVGYCSEWAVEGPGPPPPPCGPGHPGWSTYLSEGFKASRYGAGRFRIFPSPITTCTTPAISDQALGTVTTNDIETASWGGFTGVAAGQKDFSLQFINCPSDMQRILYKVDPVGGVSPGPDYAILPPLTPQTTAENISIQILENNTGTGTTYSPSNLGTWQTLTSYDQDKTLVDYELPMRARYIRHVFGPITPGKIETGMTITIQYQ